MVYGFNDYSVVSSLVSRRVASRLGEAASRYGLSVSDVLSSLAEVIANNMATIESVLEFYGGMGGKRSWRLALDALISSGAALLDALSHALREIKCDGLVIPARLTPLEGYCGFAVTLVSLDPWIDYIMLVLRPDEAVASYNFVIGDAETVPNLDRVVESLKTRIRQGARLVEEDGEWRLTFESTAKSVAGLTDAETVSTLFRTILTEAGVEWLVPDVEHGYPPEKHLELAKMYYELAGRAERVEAKAVNLLRSVEEVVKYMAKKLQLKHILVRAETGGWTPELLEETVTLSIGVEPLLPEVWRRSEDLSTEVVEKRVSSETVNRLMELYEPLLSKLTRLS